MTTFDDDIEAMLGGGPPLDAEDLLSSPSSRTSDRTERTLADAVRRQRMATGAAAENVLDGVSVPWLARVFALDPVTVRKRLVGCPKMRIMTSGALYDVAEAARYLVTPKLDQKAFLKAVKSNELPPAMQDAYWSAVIKRQKAEVEAGELWETDRVYSVFAETFKTIRETFQLFPDSLDKRASLTPAQRRELVAMLEGLQNQIHQNLIDVAKRNETPPVLARVQEEAEGAMA